MSGDRPDLKKKRLNPKILKEILHRRTWGNQHLATSHEGVSQKAARLRRW